MFKGTKSFNGDISTWKTGSIVNMKSLFGLLHSSGDVSGFNGDISNWDTSRVTDMSHMFDGEVSMNNKFNGDLSKWNTSSVTDLSYSKSLNHELLIVLLLTEELEKPMSFF